MRTQLNKLKISVEDADLSLQKPFRRAEDTYLTPKSWHKKQSKMQKMEIVAAMLTFHIVLYPSIYLLVWPASKTKLDA